MIQFLIASEQLKAY